MKRTKITALIVSTLFILALTAPIITSTSGTLSSGILIAAYNQGTQGDNPMQSKNAAVNMTILFHSDLHSELLPWPLADYNATGTGDDPTVGGMARIATKINDIRGSAGEPVLVFEVGDFLMGTPFSFAGPIQASPELHLMSPGFLNYTAICLGNHEFDYSDHGLFLILNNTNSTLGGLANMPLILCSNLNLTNDVYNLGAFIKPNATMTVNGVKIGLFSVIGYGAIATMFFTGHYNILDPIETARQQVAYLKSDPDIDLIICLSHSGWESDVVLAQQVPGIDLILSGHDHELTPTPIIVGNTTIADALALGEYLGKLEITVNPDNNPGKGVTVRSWTPIHINDTIQEYAPVAGLIGIYRAGIDATLGDMGIPATGTVIANTTTGVPGAGYVPGGETPIGDLVADAIRWQANNVSAGDPYVDFAFVPSGVIRHGLEPASRNITLYDAVSVVPLGGVPYQGPYYGWLLTSFYLLGSDVKKAMEFALYAGGDYFMQISGLRVTYTTLGPPGSRIVSIEQDFQNGTYAPIDDSKLYRVCINLEGALLIPEIGKLYPMFAVTMRNQTGHPLPTDPSEYVPLILVTLVQGDPDTAVPEWLGLVRYLMIDQRGEVDPAYNASQNRITVWEVEPLDYFMLVGLGQLLAGQQSSSNLMFGGVAVLLLIAIVGAAVILGKRT
ncbi:MAG: bifunctional metallophosphatase/5'-nucleotidase [Candidatus Freyarchaeota archaeon]|nr:bifunctional metallophosphatase/5'-nucleotidase [Candidatus Jordarchaeia archaeon]MBS7267309.1 bifunctional metallophosphatase/5'-nucleotidase [Candidatus Jordarchaeia archaeon]MBS7278259.1 bifunctional metallophosphatase/5'-nucleotidase [Candidatus Jordarchaeia archaeon]